MKLSKNDQGPEKESGIIAIVPARGGSKGVPGKNLRMVGGFPLIAYSIAVAKLAQGIDRVIVSTDSEEIREISLGLGAEVPFLRPSEYGSDSSSDREFLVHAIEWFEQNESAVPEYWVHLRPTTPFRSPEIVSAALSEIRSKPDATSLRSGHPAAESPYKWFERDADGYFQGIRAGDERIEYYNLPRQAFPPVYIPDGYVDIVRTSFIKANEGIIHGSRMVGFESPICVEVDTEEDFNRLEYQLDRQPNSLQQHLADGSRNG